MPVLDNAKHELFAQGLAKGMTAGDAYVAAGFSRNDGNASRLKGNEKVSARVAEIQAGAAEKAELSKFWVLERLVENVERAMTAEPVRDHEGNPTGEYTYQGNVANRALELLGKEMGMFVDRKEVRTGSLPEMTPDELRQFREAIARERTRRLGQGSGARTKPEPAGKLQAVH